MKKFKELTAKLRESKYGDAMSSRLPAHLDDPSHDNYGRSNYGKTKAKQPPAPKRRDKALDDRLDKFDAQQQTMKESVWESYRNRALTEAKEAPHAGFVMNFSSHTEHSYHGFAKAKQDRDAYAAHLKGLGHKVKKSSTSNQLLHGTYGNVYHVSYKPKHLKEELTPREAAAHADRMSSTLDANHNSTQDKVKKEKDTMKTRAITSSPWIKGVDHLKETEETYKVGDRVVPKIGPHKGQVHTVIHVHSTGHANIKPDLRPGSKNRYHLGAARAHPNDLTKHLEESTLLAGREEKPISHKRPEGMTNLGKPIKLKDYFDPFKKKKGVSHKTVQEAFQAAKDKKVKAGDFREPKDLKSKDDQDPQQADVQAPPPQFGGKENDSQEKKDNTPKPEKKGNKLVVKGPGVDDKFQPDPIVTPLTTMPDTASPRSGSQGVR